MPDLLASPILWALFAGNAALALRIALAAAKPGHRPNPWRTCPSPVRDHGRRVPAGPLGAPVPVSRVPRPDRGFGER